MSRIFGAYGNISGALCDKMKSVHEATGNIYQRKDFYISCGGPGGTFIFSKDDNADDPRGIAVSGIGFDINEGKIKFLNEKDWMNLFRDGQLLKNTDGHYSGVQWSNNSAQIFTDPGGVYEMFYIQLNDCVLFSTDILLINDLTGNELDVHSFGSRWLCVNQLSDNSIIKNIKRLTGGQITFIYSNGNMTIEKKEVSSEVSKRQDTRTLFSELIKSIYEAGYNVALSFSGGIDSRFLLSFLTSAKQRNFTLHTFGNPQHQDSLIAALIAKELGLEHTQLYEPIPSVSECVKLMTDYIRSTLCLNPASTILQLRYYDLMYERNSILLDGGFGEIGRRQYLNRLLFKNKSAVLNKDAGKIFHSVQLNRADIFNDEVTNEMREAAKKDVLDLCDQLPDPNEIGAENWADIFSCRTRLPNFFGSEQMRMGNSVIALMPFGMKNIYESILNVKINERTGGKLYKKIIRYNDNRLTKFPFVKGDALYPYNSGLLISKIWVRASEIRKNKKTSDSILFLHEIKEFVLDILSSSGTKNCELYNYEKIRTSVLSFYDGDKSLTSYTDWWISFEIMRRMITHQK